MYLQIIMPRRSRNPRKSHAPRRNAPRRHHKKKANMSPTSGNVAHSVEVYELETLNTETSYSAVADLSYFPRSLKIAQNYQEYKIDKLEWVFTPDFNLYDGSGSNAIPQLYTRMNRTGDGTLWTKVQFEQMGAKPHKFLTNKTISYRPNILDISTASGVGATTGAPADMGILGLTNSVRPVYGWVNTARDTSPDVTTLTSWYGLDFFIDQALPADHASTIGKLYVKASISFRYPSLLMGSSTQQKIRV